MTAGTEIQTLVNEFESRRLKHMHSQGFDCEPVRLTGPSGDTYAMVGGAGTPPRLLIHGGLSDGSVWAPLAGLLDGHVVIADRPGHGLSYEVDYRKVKSFRDAAAGWVREVADGLGTNTIDLVANSMGGYFATAFAAAHPDRVRRLVLVGCPAGIAVDAPMWLRLWGNPITGQVIRRIKPKDVDQFRTTIQAPGVAHLERVSRAQSEIEYAACLQPGFELAAYTMFRALTTLGGWRAGEMLDETMAEIAVPTLFAWGERDSVAGPEMGRSLAEGMPDARLEVIGDAGHVPWMDAPQPVAEVVNAFLTE